MGVPSVYFIGDSRYNDPRIMTSTLDDSRITLLISDSAANFLKYPANDAERNARVEIFKAIREDKKFYGDIVSLKLSLVSLDSSAAARRMAQTGVQKAFKTVKILQNFVICVDKILGLQSESEIIKNMQRYWGKDRADFISEIKKDIEIAKEKISSIGYVNMRLDSSGFSLIKDENNDNFVDKLALISTKLGVKTPKNSRLTLKLDIATANALGKLFPDVFGYLTELMEKYDELPIKELFFNKREIDFYLEMNELVKKAEAASIPFYRQVC